MHLVAEIRFDCDNPVVGKKARAFLRGLIDDAAKIGYRGYRTHLAFVDHIAGTYNWNGDALMKSNERIKDSLDLNRIMAPGSLAFDLYPGRGWEMTGQDETPVGEGVSPGPGTIKL